MSRIEHFDQSESLRKMEAGNMSGGGQEGNDRRGRKRKASEDPPLRKDKGEGPPRKRPKKDDPE